LPWKKGQIYNSRYWELSLLRLNQLGYFDQLKPDDPNTTERHLDEKNGTVDLTLKVHEKGKNSIGLQGGVSGLAGAFVGLNYSTNNFLGLGETLSVQASLGSRQRDLVFGFTEPYLFDRPIQAGFNVYTRKTNYDQARQYAIATGQNLNLPSAYLQNLQNYSQSSTGTSLERKLSAAREAPGCQAAWHQLLVRPLFAGRRQQRFQAVVRESQL
jgi:outer membrane protein insertion porin family